MLLLPFQFLSVGRLPDGGLFFLCKKMSDYRIKTFYICDRTRCERCEHYDKDGCRHTSQIEYALYDEHPADTFDVHRTKDGTSRWERWRKDNAKKKD